METDVRAIEQQVIHINRRMLEVEDELQLLKRLRASGSKTRPLSPEARELHRQTEEGNGTESAGSPVLSKEMEDGWQSGQERPHVANAVLDRMSYKGPLRGPEIYSLAQNRAIAFTNTYRGQIQKVLRERKRDQTARIKSLNKNYQARLAHRKNILEIERRKVPAAERAVRQARDLEIARETSHHTKEGYLQPSGCRRYISRLERSDGSLGGALRWGKNLANIPAQSAGMGPRDCVSVKVDDPLEWTWRERQINPWTSGEVRGFLELFLMHGKRFDLIAKELQYKSEQDCVRYYYENKSRFDLKRLSQLHKKKLITPAVVLGLSKMPREARSIRDNFVYFESKTEQE